MINRLISHFIALYYAYCLARLRWPRVSKTKALRRGCRVLRAWCLLAALLLTGHAWAYDNSIGGVLPCTTVNNVDYYCVPKEFITAASSKMTPAQIEEAGRLLARRDALKAMLEKKHRVYKSITNMEGTSGTFLTLSACSVISVIGPIPDNCKPKPDYKVPCDAADTEKQCIATRPPPPEPPKPAPVYEIDPLKIAQGWCAGDPVPLGWRVNDVARPGHCDQEIELSAADTTDILNMLIERIDEKLKALGVEP